MSKKNLAKAVISVMKEVKGMEKNSTVGSGKNAYDGTKYSDVAERFNEAMVSNGLCLIPIAIDEETKVDRWIDPQYQQQKQSIFTKVKTTYLLIHESGESQEIVGYGHGVDPQDKSAGKATTYALKNALLYTFLTPVGKIEDTESTHSNNIETPQQPIKNKPVFTKENFESALSKGSNIEAIKKSASVTPEVEKEWVEYVRLNGNALTQK